MDSRWSRLLTGSAFVALLSTAASPSLAQSSTEIEALQRQIEALQEQLDQLREQVVQKPAEAPKQAAAITKSGNDKVSLSLSGHVNRGVLLTDDGQQTDAFFVDNGNSSTRIRLVGVANASDDLSIGTNIEVQFQSNSTTSVNQDNERNVGPNNFTERKMELYFDSKTLGRLSIGQGSTASDDSSQSDLSGTSVVGYSSIADLAGGMLFRDDDDLTNISIGSSFSNFDGLSRDDRIRYDTPSLSGLKISGSLIADERWDAAASYDRNFDGTKLTAAVAYADANDNFEQINGSASVLLASGFNLTLAAGRRDFDNRGEEGLFYYGKLGYQASFLDIGKSALAIDYHYSEDVGADGDETNSIGVFAVQSLSTMATELYAGYRRYDLDREGLNLDAIDAILTGARVKF